MARVGGRSRSVWWRASAVMLALAVVAGLLVVVVESARPPRQGDASKLAGIAVAPAASGESTMGAGLVPPAVGGPQLPAPGAAPQLRVGASAMGSQEGGAELVSARTETAKVFVRPDGSRYAEVSAAPLHFRNGAGEWQDIDVSLVDRGGRLETAAAAVTSSFAGDASAPDLVRVSGGDGAGVSMGLVGAGASLSTPPLFPGRVSSLFPGGLLG